MNVVQKLIEDKHTEIAKIRNQIEHLEKVQWLKGVKKASVYQWSFQNDKPEITLYPEVPEQAAELAGHARRALGIASTTKSLDSSSGMVKMKGEADDIMLEVSALPTACRVVTVEEEVEIEEQIIEAHTETRTRYVIENPEECGAAVGVETEE